MASPIGRFFSNAFRGLSRPLASGEADVTHKLAEAGQRVALFPPLAQLGPGLSDRIDQACEPALLPASHVHLQVPEPKQFAALEAGKPADLLSDGPVTLTHPRQPLTVGLKMAEAGDARVDLRAAAPGTDWGKSGSESAVVSVYLDGFYQQDVVLAGGAHETPYALSLGRLSAGDHTLSLRFAPEKSSAGAQSVVLGSAQAQAVVYDTPQAQWAAENSPILIGRHGLANNHDDTPLALYHRFIQNPDGTTTISYAYAFSNEDGGTGDNPALEQALYGRLQDMQHVYDVTVDPQGNVLRRQFEGAWHKIQDFQGGLHARAGGGALPRRMIDFQGEYDGTHAVLRTQTTNNNVTDHGVGALRFRFPTDFALANEPDEAVLLKRPDFYRITAGELAREGKIDPKGIGSKPDPSAWGYVKSTLMDLIPGHQRTIADPRQYVYVQFNGDGLEKSPMAVKIQLQDGRWASSDLGNPKARIGQSGWSQAAVRLPVGTRPQDVKAIAYETQGAGRLVSQGPVYMLDQEFNPQMLSLPQIGSADRAQAMSAGAVIARNATEPSNG